MIAIVGGKARADSAAVASTSPAPTAPGPKAPTGRAVAVRADRSWLAPAPGFAWRSSAATAAACGAAAEVPQKRHTPSPLWKEPKKVVAPQSVAARSGLAIACGSIAAAGASPSTGPK